MSFSLTILGSASALPTSNRFPTAQLLNVNEHFFLLDCGEGTQIRLRQYKINFSKINNIFISHLHGDHYYGIFGLISTFNLLGRTRELNIFAHSKLKNKVNFVFENEKLSFNINWHELSYDKSQIILENKYLTVKSFPLKHRFETAGFIFTEKKKQDNIRKDCIQKYKLSVKDIVKIKEGNGFQLDEDTYIEHEELTIAAPKTKKFVFCTDTEYQEKYFSDISGADLIYHEATFLETEKKIAKKTKHSTAADAAEIALKTGADKLVIGHFSARYKNDKAHLTEAKNIFPNTFAASDGDVYEI